jgi:hypothetical protein
MQINIKIAAREFHRLREQVPADSVAREAFDKATRIDHSLEGVLFAGYVIPCDEEQACVIREIAAQCCPEVIPAIEAAISLASPNK